MLTPISKPLPLEIQERGFHILETIHGLSLTHQLDLACRTVLAVLVTFRPEDPVTTEERAAFKTV